MRITILCLHLNFQDLITSQIVSPNFAFLLRNCQSYSKASLLLITKLSKIASLISLPDVTVGPNYIPTTFNSRLSIEIFSSIQRITSTGRKTHFRALLRLCDPASANPTRPYPDPPFLPSPSSGLFLKYWLTESRRRL